MKKLHGQGDGIDKADVVVQRVNLSS